MKVSPTVGLVGLTDRPLSCTAPPGASISDTRDAEHQAARLPGQRTAPCQLLQRVGLRQFADAGACYHRVMSSKRRSSKAATRSSRTAARRSTYRAAGMKTTPADRTTRERSTRTILDAYRETFEILAKK